MGSIGTVLTGRGRKAGSQRASLARTRSIRHRGIIARTARRTHNLGHRLDTLAGTTPTQHVGLLNVQQSMLVLRVPGWENTTGYEM